MKGAFAVTALAAALMGGCRQPSPTGPSSILTGNVRFDSDASAAKGQEAFALRQAVRPVPFTGSLEGTQTLTPLQPPLGSVDGSGTGTATQLGTFTVVFPHTVNFATHAGQGVYAFTAASGDSLSAHFTGLAQEGPIVSIVEHATITGGTGRFAGATGSFVVERRFNPANGTTEGSFDGTISLAPAGHP